ncbi:WD repeat, SAM and U-box domain-containing 1 [Tribonema minus]|uniref:WD repeat, SAM and U-box domain-containing 1 n=1 Tax=Tribonema minus TaxID=303371 RepID=A0A835Z8M7_9STRA|nr:WD repeat, SAM and U-box domain-containing 1 [Tribonema minus]
MITRPVLVKGHRLRDEFACPITRELMRDPVIAADGHTYDREAIEMWLRTHDTSPKAGQPMDHLFLVPNHNLKRLIKDLIYEGGEGLYVKEEGADCGPDAPYRFALVPEHVLILKCLGPVESDWNGKTFRVTERGCVGGRKMPAELHGADFMHFSDATVSRKHFEVFFDKTDKCFKIRDEGSAGGTFVRVPYGVPKPLYPGLMIMLGKHQLLVTEPNRGDKQAPRLPPRSEPDVLPDDSGVDMAADSKDGSRPSTPVCQSMGGKGGRLRGEDGTGGGHVANATHMGGLDAALAVEEAPGGADDDSVADTPSPAMAAESKDDGAAMAMDEGDERSFGAAYEVEAKLARGHRALHLECFAPEGTPIQGRQYAVGRDGATLGRKQSNSIAFSHMANGQLMGIDSSISGEHARVEYSAARDCLLVLDGTPAKPSTNGTWFRLSQMHARSAPHALRDGMELLVGTVRFSAAHEMMVVEVELFTPQDAAKYMER